ncbi:hypothetical protein NDU88_005707 [Pleurodeles waltl]|uniref:Uncharacterized protein n=1 Tax=Pleurodeles waltl TaxID=8319 RepID=A0AAV7WC95_PLEWA|nr:hypothetical protein NDU88_005707 [Pleurodeles waltl]
MNTRDLCLLLQVPLLTSNPDTPAGIEGPQDIAPPPSAAQRCYLQPTSRSGHRPTAHSHLGPQACLSHPSPPVRPASSPAATAAAGASSCHHDPLCLFSGHPPLSRAAKASGSLLLCRGGCPKILCTHCHLLLTGLLGRGPTVPAPRHFLADAAALRRDPAPSPDVAAQVTRLFPRLSPTGPDAGPPPPRTSLPL